MPQLTPLAVRLLRRQLWLAGIFLLLWGQGATAANRTVVTDFDGAGRRDWTALERTNFVPLKAKRLPPRLNTRPTSDEELDHVVVTDDDGSAVETPPGSSALSAPPSTTRRLPAPRRLAVLVSFASVFASPQTERLASIGPRPPPLSHQF